MSLLIGELAFGTGSAKDEHARIAVLAGSLVAALLATVVLHIGNRHAQRLCTGEEPDTAGGGVADVLSATGFRSAALTVVGLPAGCGRGVR